MKLNTSCSIVLLLLLTASHGTSALGQGNLSSRIGSEKRNTQIIAAVRTVLDGQQDAWNRGDIAGFMNGYARSRDISFISGDSLTRGWQTVYDRYKKNYDSREKMGTLTFSDLETTVLSDNAVIVLGRWHLQRTNDQPHGRFTLIFRRTKQGWRIVHDHTSSAS